MKIIKCDITGKADVPMLTVEKYIIEEIKQDANVTIFTGERLHYALSVHNVNGYQAKDVAEEYVVAELIGMLTKRLNELRNPNSNQSEDKVGSPEIKEL